MAQNVNGDERGRRSSNRERTDREKAGADQDGREATRQAKTSENAASEVAREDAALQARLANLSSALDVARKESATGESNAADLAGQSLAKAMNLGFRVLTEFVVAIFVGTAIGWQLDEWFHTGPILLIVFLGLGTAAGFMNVYRLAAGPTGPKRGSD